MTKKVDIFLFPFGTCASIEEIVLGIQYQVPGVLYTVGVDSSFAFVVDSIVRLVLLSILKKLQQ